MNWKSLEDKCLYYRGLSDHRLMPKSYVLISLDGRSFSKLIKNKYEKPFDDKFIYYMNETAKHLCEKVGNCKLAYTQSDEISLVLVDFDKPMADAFFGYRLCKLQSILAAMAASKFNHLVTMDLLSTPCSQQDMIQMVSNQHLVEFDCRAWNVPDTNEMFAYFLWRQNDCIRNSKQQAAQTYLSHKELNGLDTDRQIRLLKEKKGIDWHDYDEDKKYGRLIYKERELFHNEKLNADYERNVWKVHDAFILNDEENREKFISIIKNC